MDNLTRFKKGELLCREGEPISDIIIVKKGKVSLFLERSGRKLEVLSLGPNSVLGEQGLFGAAKQTYSAEASQESQVMKVPIDLIQKQVGQAPPGVKLVLKSLADESKVVRKVVQGYKMEGDKSPCPQISVPRVFSLINLVGRHTGVEMNEVEGGLVLDWPILKLYASRIFNESFERMKGALSILTKLKLAELEYKKTDDDIEELSKIRIPRVQTVEDFAEFFQYHYFKGAKAEILQVDPLALKVTKALSEAATDIDVDRKGIVSVPYDDLLESLKTSAGLELKSTHFNLLEKKGLFIVRKTNPEGVVQLQFDKVEFENTVLFWQIIREIDLWNERGEVLMVEASETNGSGGQTCVSCQGELQEEHKFCPACGAPVQAAS